VLHINDEIVSVTGLTNPSVGIICTYR